MMNSRLITWSDSTEQVEKSTTPTVPCRLFTIDYSKPMPQPKKGRALSSFISDWVKDDEKSLALTEARAWVADATEKSGEGATLKSIRLKKDLSQTQLAELMQTSQPHIARIERGRDSVTLETLRKLSMHLEVDFNTLVAAIERQERTLSKENK